jgi:hypothetical protein
VLSPKAKTFESNVKTSENHTPLVQGVFYSFISSLPLIEKYHEI